MSFNVPDSFDYSQLGGETQLTQAATQFQSQAAPIDFSNVWGVLVSCATSTMMDLDEMSMRNGGASRRVSAVEPFVERPARVEFVDGQNMYSIGRLASSDVPLQGKKISATHAVIMYVDGEVRLKDLSTNGTFVRGRRVGKGAETVLNSGDEIIFGPTSASPMMDFRYLFQSALPTTDKFDSDAGGGIYKLYDVRETLGKGSFATVRKGIHRTTGKSVAIKIMEKQRFALKPEAMNQIVREVEIMKALDHKYCIKYIDYFEDATRMWLVLEYSGGGDLLEYIMKRGGLSESETREIALMTCEALAYLHSKGVAHRDVKPENLLLSTGTNPICKVTDFGLAKMVVETTKLRTLCGTPSYLAPEVLHNPNASGDYGVAVDAWSIGVVLYSCLTNATPFDESESTPIRERIAARRIDFDEVRRTGCSEIGVNFLQRLLVVDPLQRMTLQEALSHDWLATLPNNDSVARPSVLGSNTPSITTPSFASPSISTGSFGNSQGLDNLRLGTPAKGRSIQHHTAPTRPRTIERQPVIPPSPISSKQKQPASAFSSSSSIDHRMSVDQTSPLVQLQPELSVVAESVIGSEDGSPAAVVASSSIRRSSRRPAPSAKKMVEEKEEVIPVKVRKTTTRSTRGRSHSSTPGEVVERVTRSRKVARLN